MGRDLSNSLSNGSLGWAPNLVASRAVKFRLFLLVNKTVLEFKLFSVCMLGANVVGPVHKARGRGIK